VADKFMVAVALVLLVDINPTPYASFYMSLAAIIIIGREITISALREWMAEMGARNSVAVSIIGKVKTTAQMTALLLLIYAQPIAGLPTITIGFILLYIAVGLISTNNTKATATINLSATGSKKAPKAEV